MAFVARDAKIVTVEELFNITKARFYKFASLDQIYKKSKLINMGGQITEDGPLPEPDIPQHYLSGNVIENTLPVDRVVHIHRSDTGELVGSTTSSGVGGYFYVETTYSGSHYVVCLDDIIGVDYNDLIYGQVFPATISG